MPGPTPPTSSPVAPPSGPVSSPAKAPSPLDRKYLEDISQALASIITESPDTPSAQFAEAVIETISKMYPRNSTRFFSKDDIDKIIDFTLLTTFKAGENTSEEDLTKARDLFHIKLKEKLPLPTTSQAIVMTAAPTDSVDTSILEFTPGEEKPKNDDEWLTWLLNRMSANQKLADLAELMIHKNVDVRKNMVRDATSTNLNRKRFFLNAVEAKGKEGKFGFRMYRNGAESLYEIQTPIHEGVVTVLKIPEKTQEYFANTREFIEALLQEEPQVVPVRQATPANPGAEVHPAKAKPQSSSFSFLVNKIERNSTEQKEQLVYLLAFSPLKDRALLLEAAASASDPHNNPLTIVHWRDTLRNTDGRHDEHFTFKTFSDDEEYQIKKVDITNNNVILFNITRNKEVVLPYDVCLARLVEGSLATRKDQAEHEKLEAKDSIANLKKLLPALRAKLGIYGIPERNTDGSIKSDGAVKTILNYSQFATSEKNIKIWTENTIERLAKRNSTKEKKEELSFYETFFTECCACLDSLKQIIDNKDATEKEKSVAAENTKLLSQAMVEMAARLLHQEQEELLQSWPSYTTNRTPYEEALSPIHKLTVETKKITDALPQEAKPPKGSPASSFIGVLKLKIPDNEKVEKIREWTERWFNVATPTAPSLIDEYRNNNKDLELSPEQIITTKELLFEYIYLLEAMDTTGQGAGQIGFNLNNKIADCIRILSGKTTKDDSKEDIRYLVDNYSRDTDLRMIATVHDITKKLLEGKAPTLDPILHPPQKEVLEKLSVHPQTTPGSAPVSIPQSEPLSDLTLAADQAPQPETDEQIERQDRAVEGVRRDVERNAHRKSPNWWIMGAAFASIALAAVLFKPKHGKEEKTEVEIKPPVPEQKAETSHEEWSQHLFREEQLDLVSFVSNPEKYVTELFFSNNSNLVTAVWEHMKDKTNGKPKDSLHRILQKSSYLVPFEGKEVDVYPRILAMVKKVSEISQKAGVQKMDALPSSLDTSYGDLLVYIRDQGRRMHDKGIPTH